MKTQAPLDTKLIESVLDDALNRFSCLPGSNLPDTGMDPRAEEKFNHVTDIACVQKPRDNTRADYYLCWYMDTLVRFQDHIPKAGDFKRYSLCLEDAEFDCNLELTRIQKIFASIINKEVIMDTGIFYYGDDTPQNSRSQGSLSTKVGLVDRTPDVFC